MTQPETNVHNDMQLRSKPRHTRTRTGCLTCRSRKKKCDQVKPRCAGCRRNVLTCEWPAPPAAIAPRSRSPEMKGSDGTVVIRRTVQIPPPVPILHAGGSERPCALHPQSVSLLSHYLRETASSFAMTRLESNPFITILLPLGYTDDLLMHGLLAVSGAHLAYKEPGSLEIAKATWQHYSKLISGLRTEFALLQHDDVERMERLLSVLMVASHYEAVSADSRGIMFKHLNASRELIQSLLSRRGDRELARSGPNLDTLSLNMEMYSYLVCSNYVTTYSTASEDTLTVDPFILPLEEMERWPNFGAMFGGSHGLFKLIPEISLVASRRLAEEAAGAEEPSASLKRLYEDVYYRIKSWMMPPKPPGEAMQDWEAKRDAAELLRQSLFAYILAAMAGSIVHCPTRIAIRDHLQILFAYSTRVATSPYAANILWPMVIAGSFATKPEGQLVLRHAMGSGPFRLRHINKLGDVLQLIWDDPDPRAYGPYGLRLIMQKHGLSVGIA